MSADPKPGDLRVWHIPQVPGKAFRVPVDSLAEGAKLRANERSRSGLADHAWESGEWSVVERWESAEADPKVIRSYDHPDDGRYLLGVDVVAWLRDLAGVAHGGSAVAAAIHAPFLDRLVETIEQMLVTEAGEEAER